MNLGGFLPTKKIRNITALGATCSALCTIAIVALTTEQVIARYFFSASSVAMQELGWYLFGFLIMLSSAHALKNSEHVRVDVLYSNCSPRTQAILDLIGYIVLATPMCLILIGYGIGYAALALTFENPTALDHWTATLLSRDNGLYEFSAKLEGILRTSVLAGEISADPGGLPMRWFIRAAIPLGGLLLLLEVFIQIGSCFKRMQKPRDLTCP